MELEHYIVTEESEFTRGRKDLTTAYFFIAIAAVFYVLFFVNTQQLPVIGCAFLVNIAAIIYIFRSIPRITPTRQILLANKCAKECTRENALRMCASLKKMKLFKANSYVYSRVHEALEACEKTSGLSESVLETIRTVLADAK